MKISYDFRNIWFKLTFVIIGFTSVIWFLIRVIPKPSRASYPCMQAAAPFAASFVCYLIGLGSATLILRKAKNKFKKGKYILASLSLVIGLLLGFTTQVINQIKINAQELQEPQDPNDPSGTARGIFPGRVVWTHDPAATDESCTNSTNDYWFEDSNTDQEVVDQMLSKSLQSLTGQSSDAEAWNAIFAYYNNENEFGNVGYVAGEKIVIKINLNGEYGMSPKEANINTSPQICLALLDQLINVAGVPQSDISIGDPNVNMNDVTYNKLSSAFPEVIYWGASIGRTAATSTNNRVLHYSNNRIPDKLPQAYIDAKYMINVPVLKKHHRAGISITAKNHFGSLAPYSDAGNAMHLHPYLPCTSVSGLEDNGEYGAYRVFVDLMGHKDLGQKTILYLVDGLWGSTNWGHPPIKWRMSPFGIDWPSSIFSSLDPVALESVCYDFLYEEFDEDHPLEGSSNMTDNSGPYPHFSGTDDHLHQAADPSNWPAGINYDPEDDGSLLGSLGVHEHWNNSADKQYTRNLGTGDGIELVSTYVVTSTDVVDYTAEGFELHTNYPNPFSGSTTLRYTLAIPSYVQVKIFNANGQLMKVMTENQRKSGLCELTWDGTTDSGERVAPGMYICSLLVENDRGSFEMSNSMLAVE